MIRLAVAFFILSFASIATNVRADDEVFPDVPTNLATYVYIDNVAFSWADAYTNVAGFNIERAPDVGGSPGSWTLIGSTPAPYGYFPDSELSLGTYWYRVNATNGVGNSAFSEPISATIVMPVAPTNLTARFSRTRQVDLTWLHPPGDAPTYKLERAPDVGGVPGTWAEIMVADTYYTFYSDAGLEPGRTYWYRVRGSNVLGDSPYSSEVSATVLAGQVVRVMQWNIEKSIGRQTTINSFVAYSVARVLHYNQPDVMMFCEVDAQGLSVAQNEAAIISWVTNNVRYLGGQPGVTFFVAVSSQTDNFNRNAVISRYPIVGATTYNDGLRGLHAFKVQFPGTNAMQFFHTHIKCCADDCNRKQVEAQFDANIIGAFAATNSMPYVFAGDWNEEEERVPPVCPLSGTYHPIRTIREGGKLAEFKPTMRSGEYRTWNTDYNNSSQPSIRFDYILSASNRLAATSGYVFNSLEMGSLYDGSTTDSYYASDHFTVFADFLFPEPTPPFLWSRGVVSNAFTFSVSGKSNSVVVVEVSDDLTNWTSFTTNTIGATPLNFSDTNWAGFQGRYYRARVW